MTINFEVKKWKKKTWKNIDILMEDTFYARTPDLIKSFPPSPNAKFKITGENEIRSTLEEIALDPLPEEINKKPEENTNEKTVKTDTTVVVDQPPKI